MFRCPADVSEDSAAGMGRAGQTVRIQLRVLMRRLADKDRIHEWNPHERRLPSQQGMHPLELPAINLSLVFKIPSQQTRRPDHGFFSDLIS